MNRDSVRNLIANTVINICKKELFFLYNIKIQGLLGVTIDDHEVILMQIEEGHSLENDRFTKLVSPNRYNIDRNDSTVSISKEKENVRYHTSGLQAKRALFHSSRSQCTSEGRSAKRSNIDAGVNLTKTTFVSKLSPAAATMTLRSERLIENIDSTTLKPASSDVMTIDLDDYDNEEKFDPIPETTNAKYVAVFDKPACQGDVKIEASSFSNLRNPILVQEHSNDLDIGRDAVKELSLSSCTNDADFFPNIRNTSSSNVSTRSAQRRARMRCSNMGVGVTQSPYNTEYDDGWLEPGEVVASQGGDVDGYTGRQISQEIDNQECDQEGIIKMEESSEDWARRMMKTVGLTGSISKDEMEDGNAFVSFDNNTDGSSSNHHGFDQYNQEEEYDDEEIERRSDPDYNPVKVLIIFFQYVPVLLPNEYSVTYQ